MGGDEALYDSPDEPQRLADFPMGNFLLDTRVLWLVRRHVSTYLAATNVQGSYCSSRVSWTGNYDWAGRCNFVSTVVLCAFMHLLAPQPPRCFCAPLVCVMTETVL